MQYSHVRKNVLVVDVRLTHKKHMFFYKKKKEDCLYNDTRKPFFFASHVLDYIFCSTVCVKNSDQLTKPTEKEQQ